MLGVLAGESRPLLTAPGPGRWTATYNGRGKLSTLPSTRAVLRVVAYSWSKIVNWGSIHADYGLASG